MATGNGRTGKARIADSRAIRALDHTADVGFDIGADTLEGLFTAAADALFLAIMGDDDTDHTSEPAAAAIDRIDIACTAHDVTDLLVAWLRELLWVHHDRGLVLRDARFLHLDEHELRASVSMAPSGRPPIREIKGVTWHELAVRRTDGRFNARIIFDV